MTRFLLTLLTAQLVALAVACGVEPSGLSPDAAYAAGVAAIEAGDADRALALLDEAAGAGHLDAHRKLIGAYEHGSLRASGRAGADWLPVHSSEHRAERYQSTYARFMGDAVRAGDPDAIRQATKDVLGLRLSVTDREQLPEPIRGLWDDVDLDSARALYRLVADVPSASQIDLAVIARALGDDAAFHRHLDRAIAGGEPEACVYKVQARYGPPDFRSAAGLKANYDRMADCHPANEPRGSGFLDNIRQSAARGSARSAEVLDSLEALGLYERYPQLAQR